MEKKRLTENSTIITHIVDVNNMFISELRTIFLTAKWMEEFYGRR